MTLFEGIFEFSVVENICANARRVIIEYVEPKILINQSLTTKIFRRENITLEDINGELFKMNYQLKYRIKKEKMSLIFLLKVNLV